MLLVQVGRPYGKGLSFEKKGLEPRNPRSRCRGRCKGRVRKRATLKEDSSLGSKGINILDVDLSWLMGGKSLTIPCILSCNGYSIKTTALTNSRANAFALLNAECT